MRINGSRLLLLTVFMWSSSVGSVWAARDAAFLSPGSGGSQGNRTEEAIVVEPKAEVDVGETPINVGRRATFFFVNPSNAPVEIESLKANGDSNVRADIVADDCTKEKRIVVGSRCSVTVETTPTGAGSWTAEILMTHKAAGRIARARVTGKTSNVGTQDKGNTGLSLSTKDIKPVDFGEVEVGSGKAARSALMVNDSNEVITLQSIDVIAAENGLQRLEQGCVMDMDLKMGESCPVTLIWKPEVRSNLSTDLIIRHTGRLGFAVVPIRGVAKEVAGLNSDAGKTLSPTASGSKPAQGKAGESAVLPPPTADEIEKATAKSVPPLSADALALPPLGEGSSPIAKVKKANSGPYHLIGTVGTRALIYKPDGTTVTAAVGDVIDDEDGEGGVKIVDVGPKQVEIYIDKKIKILHLEVVNTLTRKATQAHQKSEPGKIGQEITKVSSTKMDGPDSNTVPLPVGK